MPLDNPKGGMGYSAEFQSSALPWVTSSLAPATGSPVEFNFPKISRFISINNLSTSSISFGFTRSGVVSTNNKYTLTSGQSILMEVRVKTLYLQAETGVNPEYTLFAGLTNIDSSMMPLLSGTLPDSTPGWTGVG